MIPSKDRASMSRRFALLVRNTGDKGQQPQTHIVWSGDRYRHVSVWSGDHNRLVPASDSDSTEPDSVCVMGLRHSTGSDSAAAHQGRAPHRSAL